MVGITNLISFVEDESRKQQVTDANVKERIDKVNQEQLDYFAATNDVVMYQMKLGQTED
jgi:hypothetical protein